jgi:hypothetical protein
MEDQQQEFQMHMSQTLDNTIAELGKRTDAFTAGTTLLDADMLNYKTAAESDYLLKSQLLRDQEAEGRQRRKTGWQMARSVKAETALRDAIEEQHVRKGKADYLAEAEFAEAQTKKVKAQIELKKAQDKLAKVNAGKTTEEKVEGKKKRQEDKAKLRADMAEAENAKLVAMNELAAQIAARAAAEKTQVEIDGKIAAVSQELLETKKGEHVSRKKLNTTLEVQVAEQQKLEGLVKSETKAREDFSRDVELRLKRMGDADETRVSVLESRAVAEQRKLALDVDLENQLYPHDQQARQMRTIGNLLGARAAMMNGGLDVFEATVRGFSSIENALLANPVAVDKAMRWLYRTNQPERFEQLRTKFYPQLQGIDLENHLWVTPQIAYDQPEDLTEEPYVQLPPRVEEVP